MDVCLISPSSLHIANESQQASSIVYFETGGMWEFPHFMKHRALLSVSVLFTYISGFNRDGLYKCAFILQCFF